MSAVQLAGRGAGFEELLAFTHAVYARRGWALVQKVSVPVRLTHERAGSGFVGFYAGKSTVDFVGCLAGGRGVALDAKSTRNRTRIPWNVTHFPSHQQEFLRHWASTGGLALLLVQFSTLDRYFAIPMKAWDAHQAPSWSLAECAEWGHEVRPAAGYPLDWLAPWR